MDRSHISIEKLRRANLSEAVEVLAQAYYNNPLPMHAFGRLPSKKRLVRVRRIYRGAVESALVAGHIYVVRRNGAIVATAIAYSPDSKVQPMAQNLIHYSSVLTTGPRAAIAYHQFSRHVSQFTPTTPHWHLFAVGVAPSFQRQGIGEALVKHFNWMADKAGMPSFLFTAREDQVPFYNALGYKVTNLAAVPKLEKVVVRMMERAVATA